MTAKEQTRLQVLNSLLAEHMTLDQAATLMGVSPRHTRRILADYRRNGAASLAHGHRGRKPANASLCPVSGEACPKPTAGQSKRPWRYRSPWVKWNAAPWTSTTWWLQEVCYDDDRPGTGPPAPGDPGPQADRRGFGQLPGRRSQQAVDLSGDAG